MQRKWRHRHMYRLLAFPCGPRRNPGWALRVVAWLVLTLPACATDDPTPPDLAIVRVPEGLISDEMLQAVAHEFYAQYPDEYDQLVVLPSLGFVFPQAFYTPVRNDILGIGYGHDEALPEVFHRPEFGASRLGGIVVMASGWHNSLDLDDPDGSASLGGRDSLLGVLAQETGHQWLARVYYRDLDGQASLGILGRTANHWSYLLDTGGSPMGGNRWMPEGDGFRGPVIEDDAVAFSPLDLHLMGVLAADQVPDMTLLHPDDESACGILQPSGAISGDQEGNPSGCSYYWHDRDDAILPSGTTESVTIEQIVAVEGPRIPAAGPSTLRQAWILAVPDDTPVDLQRAALADVLREAWGSYFEAATGGRLTIDSRLRR